jgi:dTDP-4-dehydrorhamnose 3,5-epimerase
VIGDGRNFVRTMRDLAEQGVRPSVVDDQVGRLTFTTELARATRHLIDSHAPFGTYNVTNGGEPCSWAAIAAEVFALAGRERSDVVRVTTDEYVAGAGGAVAPRPLAGVLDLAKIRATGFEPQDQLEGLRAYWALEASRP